MEKRLLSAIYYINRVHFRCFHVVFPKKLWYSMKVLCGVTYALMQQTARIYGMFFVRDPYKFEQGCLFYR
jgi:hypothetical protein